MTLKWIALSVGVSLVLLAGCKGPDRVMAPKTSAPDPVPASLYPNITFRGDLDRRLVLNGDPYITPRTNITPMRVTVRLRNITSGNMGVSYRFKWFGPGREPFDVDGPWRYAEIPSTLEYVFSGNPVRIATENWELEVRPN